MIVLSGTFNIKQDLVVGSMINVNLAGVIARTSTQG